MPKHTDDIYKKESVPKFARRKYRSNSRDKKPDPTRGGGGKAGRGASGMFDAMNAPRRRSGGGGSGGGRGSGRSSRTSGPTKANLVIVAILIVALLVYGGIFAAVRFGGKFQGKPQGADQTARYNKPIEPKEKKPEDTEPPAEMAQPTHQASEIIATNIFGTSVNNFIKQVKQARTEINVVDSPLNKRTPAESIQHLEAQLKKSPNLISLKRQLGKIHYELGNFNESVRYFGEILTAEPSDIYTRLLLATALFEAKDFDNAIAITSWILGDDQFNSDARQILARSFMQKKNFEAAIPHLRVLSDENTLDVAAQNNLGVAYMHGRKYKLAATIFEGTIQIDPSHPVGYFNLAVCYAKWPFDTTLKLSRDLPPKGGDMIQKACNVLYAAQDQFGTPFVRQWILGSEFDDIAKTAPFLRLKERFSVNDGTMLDAITMPTKQREESFGKAILPKQIDD